MTGEELVNRYGPMVRELSLRLTGERAEAEDLAQESLLKAIRGLDSFEGRSSLGSWLYRITVNAWKNRLRARSARKTQRFLSADGEAVLSEPESAPSPEPTPEAEALAAERRLCLDRALEGLSPDERRVLELRELDGLSYGEIAEALGWPLGTVKSRLSRARDILAQELSPEDEHDA